MAAVKNEKACRLLSEALLLLDEADEQLAAIHVAHALEILECVDVLVDDPIIASG